jgi:hypothetical protein
MSPSPGRWDRLVAKGRDSAKGSKSRMLRCLAAFDPIGHKGNSADCRSACSLFSSWHMNHPISHCCYEFGASTSIFDCATSCLTMPRGPRRPRRLAPSGPIGPNGQATATCPVDGRDLSHARTNQPQQTSMQQPCVRRVRGWPPMPDLGRLGALGPPSCRPPGPRGGAQPQVGPIRFWRRGPPPKPTLACRSTH